MTPGEKLRLLGDAADRLVTRSLSEAQVVVETFGFVPPSPPYDGAAPDRGYWMGALSYVPRDSDPGDIEGLVAFLKGEDAAPEASTATWASQPLTLFLSHLHDHRDFVGRVQVILNTYGASSFVAHKDIPSGKLWRDEIRGGLRSCSALVAFLHRGFRASQWCDQEVGWALGRDIPVIPVRPPSESEDRNGFIDDVQYIVLSNEDEWFTAKRIIEALVNEPRTRKAALRSAAEALAHSASFNESRWAWGLIEPHESELESDTLRRLEFASATNNQVSLAVRTPDGTPISRLIKERVARLEPAPPAPVSSEDPWAMPDEPPF